MAPRRHPCTQRVPVKGSRGQPRRTMENYDHSPRDVQQAVFRRQLELAQASRLPVIIHCREAWEDCLAILGEEWAASGLGGILHCFTGTASDANARTTRSEALLSS